MTTPTITNTVEVLEALVDRHGLLHIITGLEIMCGEKAEHIKSNWQDSITAKPWDMAARRLGKIAREIEPLDI